MGAGEFFFYSMRSYFYINKTVHFTNVRFSYKIAVLEIGIAIVYIK
jgi:hypothetical protein